MELTPEILESIESYLNKELLEEELVSFEQKLNDDKDLRKFVEEQKIIQAGISLSAEKEIKKRLNVIHSDYFDKEELSSEKIVPIKGNTSIIKWIGLAASFLLLFGFWFYSSTKTQQNKLVFTETIEITVLPTAGKLGSSKKSKKLVKFFQSDMNYFDEYESEIRIYSDKDLEEFILSNITKRGSDLIELKMKDGSSLAIRKQK